VRQTRSASSRHVLGRATQGRWVMQGGPLSTHAHDWFTAVQQRVCCTVREEQVVGREYACCRNPLVLWFRYHVMHVSGCCRWLHGLLHAPF
jgi:hypothetical protein